MGREEEGRLCFCEKWLNLATGVSSWGEAFSESRDRPQIMAGCKFYISVLWIGGRGPFFLGRVKSVNLNIFAKATTVQRRHFHFLIFVVFFIACFIL